MKKCFTFFLPYIFGIVFVVIFLLSTIMDFYEMAVIWDLLYI